MKKKIAIVISFLLLGILLLMFFNIKNPMVNGTDGIELLQSEYGNQKITKLSTDNSNEDSIITNSTYELDEDSIDEKINEIKVGIEDTALANGTTYEQLLMNEYGYDSEESFEETTKTQIENFIKLRLAVYTYAENNKINLTKKEYNEKLQEYATKFGYDDKSKFTEECDENTIACEMLYDKTLNLIKGE